MEISGQEAENSENHAVKKEGEDEVPKHKIHRSKYDTHMSCH